MASTSSKSHGWKRRWAGAPVLWVPLCCMRITAQPQPLDATEGGHEEKNWRAAGAGRATHQFLVITPVSLRKKKEEK